MFGVQPKCLFCGIPEWHLQCTYQKQRLWHQYIEPHQHMCLHRELSQLSSNTDASVLGNLKGYVAVSHCKPGYKARCSYRLYCSLSRQAPTSPARNAFAACCLLQSNIDQVRSCARSRLLKGSRGGRAGRGMVAREEQGQNQTVSERT